MKGLSVRQPSTFAIFHLGKNIENRDWTHGIIGRVAIHASGTLSKYDYEDGRDWIMANIGLDAANKIPHKDSLERGVILGTVKIVGNCLSSSSPWFVGKWGFILEDPVLFPEPVPFKAMLGFWDVPDELIFHVCRRCGRSRDGHARFAGMLEAGACEQFMGEFEE